ncbi:MAG: UV DNA damage repair endonuclease UvsE [Syntrophomonadaceae bacterium]|nr:UV DNA damage repair endonuclease UvsE [Syntrophomonadaceae bacterium]MDD4549986.1 UV DNA damage repair endonuclease UvsE [Syntrophomonadaceae bacterium]
MRISFGYVAMSVVLKDCSPSRTITLQNLSKIASEKDRFARLTSIARENLDNTQRLFFHNRANDIKIFRITSKLIPLATHPVTENWDWFAEVKDKLKSLGDYARENDFRISAHPDHFTLLNSPREEVTEASVRDLEYHLRILDGMRLDSSAKLVIHVGGGYKNKEASLARFIQNYKLLSRDIKQRIVLENDDKIYTARDVLELCQELKIPMVLDIHHHWCNNYNDDISDYLADIFSTWDGETRPPKIHISSPKDEKHFRSHADNVESSFLLDFMAKAKQLNRDFDVMIEAKNKDQALFNLMTELRQIPYIRFIDGGCIEVW